MEYYKNYDESSESAPSYDGTATPSYSTEDSQIERLSWPRCLSAVPEDVLEILDDDSESDSQ